ncbi:MAG TPA: PAS domain-containing sensor histidine kinase, partial [Alphaproteobacteria bacterium]|nr:PAS domain-containing sensor histidine kinase [Alphaproteobacteria bacterium]
LRASEERFRDLIEGSLQGVCIHRDFVPVFVNQAYASILGFDSVDAVFRLGSILSTIPDRHRAEAWSRNAALLDGGGYTGRVRVQNIRPDGRALWLDIIDRVVQWEGAPAVQVTLMDVTDHVLREQELERSRGRLEAQAADLARLAEEQGRLRLEAERLRGEAEAASAAKSQFLAVMSHELRTPLNAVIGFSGMIEGQVHGPADPRYTEYATLIREGGEHLLALINDLLDFSKADAGRLGLVIEPLDVARTVDAAVRLVGPQIAARGHRLHLDLPPRAVVAADERRVKQILVNLLSNAMKYTPDGGDIGVSAAVQGRWLLLTVTDTGVGIAEADQERVLQPFQQVDNQLTRGGEGTGLGLPLAKRLAELHGGSLRLFSRLGTGTAVTVALPLQPAAAGGPEVAASLAG